LSALCGLFRIDGIEPDREPLERMRDALAHRGAQAGELYIAPGVGLSGRSDYPNIPLPYSSPDGHYAVAWNGAIDNLGPLSNELGLSSRQSSEILIEGFSRWGEHLFEKLEGAFALALWDAREKQLILACDRLGQRSLYWRSVGPYIYFASHLSALLQATERKAPMDIPTLDSFLYHGAAPRDRCIFQGIEKLPPAHWVRFQGEQKETRRYWKLEFEPKERLSEAEWLDRIENLLVEILRNTFPPDKPTAVILDDSLESALLVPLLKKAGTGAVKTIEFDYAGQSASRFHLDSQTSRENRERIELNAQDLLNRLPEWVLEAGEPLGEFSALAIDALGRVFGNQDTILLSGLGGSIALAGQDQACLVAVTEKARQRWPRFFRKFLFPWVAHRLERRASGGSSLKAFCEAALRADLPAEYAYRETEGWTFHRRIAYRNKVRGRIAGLSPSRRWRDKFLEAPAQCDVDRMISTDYAARLPDRLLPPLDLAASRHGLSIRCPFLDTRFIQTAARIPVEMKMKSRTPGYLLKQLAARHGIAIRDLNPREGTESRLTGWMTGYLFQAASRILLSEQTLDRGYFYPDFIRYLVEEHGQGRQDHTQRLWSLFILEIWHRIFIDRTPVKEMTGCLLG